MTFAEVVAAAKMARDLFGFLETDEIASLLGDVELSAAREAFRRIPTATDKRAQIHTCIGHLNSAYNGYAYALNNMTSLDRTLLARDSHFSKIRNKAVFVLCIRAICNYYVEEYRHTNEDLAAASYTKARKLTSDMGQLAWIVTGPGLFDFIYTLATCGGTWVGDIVVSDETIRSLTSLLHTRPAAT